MNAIESVLAERKRQIKEEGWTSQHDAERQPDELATAGALYALPEMCRNWASRPFGVFIDWVWPFESAAWKPTPSDRRRELVKAAALIIAEIDAMDRRGNGFSARDSAQ